MTRQDDCMNDEDKAQQEEQGKKVLVPVRCHKHADEEELPEENDRDRPFETPRRWYIY